MLQGLIMIGALRRRPHEGNCFIKRFLDLGTFLSKTIFIIVSLTSVNKMS